MERERPLPPGFSDEAPEAPAPGELPAVVGEDSELVFADAMPSDEAEPLPAEFDGPTSEELVLADAMPSEEGAGLPSTLDGDASSVELAGIAPGAEQELADAIARDAAQQGARQLAEEQRQAARKPPAPRVRKPAAIVSTQAGAQGQAICPACQAKNSAHAIRCGRCGEEIPDPKAGATRARRRGEGYATHRERLKQQDSDDPWDTLPEAKQREFNEHTATIEARSQAHSQWVEAYTLKGIAGAAIALGVTGLLVSALALPPLPAALSFLFDLGLGGAAAAFTLADRGGRVRGGVSFGGAAIASAVLKLGLGGLAGLMSMGGAFGIVFYVGLICAGCCGGFLFGAHVEGTFVDREAG